MTPTIRVDLIEVLRCEVCIGDPILVAAHTLVPPQRSVRVADWVTELDRDAMYDRCARCSPISSRHSGPAGAAHSTKRLPHVLTKPIIARLDRKASESNSGLVPACAFNGR
jgi:hypothetical protein